MNFSKKRIDAISSLVDESEKILQMARVEWEHMKTLLLAAKTDKGVPGNDNILASNWVEFRQRYEKWYRSCLGLMRTTRFTGLDDFKELYRNDHSELPSIKTALLNGFSVKNYCGFSDRMENQVAILLSMEDEFEQIATDNTKIALSLPHTPYVDLSRIDELRQLNSSKFDLTKLIRLCEELNKCDANQCYLATAMLTRAILDHIPPLFQCDRFSQVANNYKGSKSFKESMRHLANSSRKIADAHLHIQIRNKETLPNKTQVDFSNDLDVLLAEIVRILK